MTYRAEQTERGNEALQFLADFLETKGGLFSVSMKETKYSMGVWGSPDLVFRDEGIEVKRVEFMARSRFNKGEEFRLHIGHVGLKHQFWNDLKKWCEGNKKIPALVIVLTWGKHPPIFVKFSKDQVDEMQRQQIKNQWIHLSSWDALLQGEILK